MFCKRSGSSPKLRGGGNLQSGRQKYNEKYGPLFRKNSQVFQMNNALIYMFPTFKTKREKGCIWVRIRGAKLSLHHEGGGAVALNCIPLNPPVNCNEN